MKTGLFKISTTALIILLTMWISSCTKNDPAPSGPKVYYAGNYNTTGSGKEDQLVYWKGEEMIKLTDGSHMAQLSGRGLTVSGNDVYVYGYERDANGRDVAKYWKNGTPVTIADANLGGSYVYGMQIVGNDVYAAIYAYDKNSQGVPMYWKNNSEVMITDKATGSAGGAVVYGIGVVNGDVYVAGQTGDDAPAVWKNGTATLLDHSGYTYAQVRDVITSGNDVYVTGLKWNDGTPYVACYWKNGQPVALSSEANSSQIVSAYASNGDFYFVISHNNNDNTSFMYWKNGTDVQTILPDNSNGWPESFNFVGKDIYYILGSKKAIKNGEVIKSIDVNDDTYFGSMFVTQ